MRTRLGQLHGALVLAGPALPVLALLLFRSFLVFTAALLHLQGLVLAALLLLLAAAPPPPLRIAVLALTASAPQLRGPQSVPRRFCAAWPVMSNKFFATAAANHKSPALAGRGRGACSSMRCLTSVSVANRDYRATLLWGCRQRGPCDKGQLFLLVAQASSSGSEKQC